MALLRTRGSVRARLLLVQHDVLEMVATGSDLLAAMDELCRRVEQIVPDVICSVLSVDSDGRLHHLGSPSLSPDFAAVVDGLHIGPKAGTCGTAAFRGEPVETRDIRTDPLWADYQALPLPDGVRACWSNPIKGRDGRVRGTFAFYFRSGRGARDIERQVVEACIHICAIAIENEAAAAQLRRLAFEDTTTGLMSRAAFQVEVAKAFAAASRAGRAVAVHYIDLDQFKGINETLGHQIGDVLLRAVADRLKRVIGDGSVVARFGGDEFVVLQAASDRETAADLAWQILAIFNEPFAIVHGDVGIEASIGIAVGPQDGETVTDLLKNAELALYSAKAGGRGRHAFYAESLSEEASYRRTMTSDLKRALDGQQFELVYQPIVPLDGSVTVACEALLRWHHPKRGLVPTPDFILVAEELGLIVKIGEWVLGEACRQAARWPDDVSVSVNLSPIQLKNPLFAEEVRQALSASGLSAGRLILEITETSVLTDEPVTRDLLLGLRAMGVRFALDDFGTGYSPLWALREFPIDRIKIDKSFVADIERGKPYTSIVSTMIALARSLEMSVTAEGVETEAQAEILRAEGCDDAQGFHFSYPMSAEAIARHFSARSVAPPRKAIAG